MKEVRIDAGSPAELALWRSTADLVRLLDGLPWVLIGGQMVAIIEREFGGRVGRTTLDVDALLDVRAEAAATRLAAQRLLTAGYRSAPTVDGLAYRFLRGTAMVDLLAPDHLGARADLTTDPPGQTLEAPGGRQALARKRDVRLHVAGERFTVPIPSLAGAIVIKAKAAASSSKDKHQRDLARLLALIPDIEAIRAELSAKERASLRGHSELLLPSHPAWARIPNASDGIIALARLGTP